MQGTHVSRAVTYLGRTYISDCVLWVRVYNGLASIGEMHHQDLTLRIESLDCVSLTLASLRRKLGLPTPQKDILIGPSPPGEGKSASLCLRWIDPFAVTSRGRKVGFGSAQTD